MVMDLNEQYDKIYRYCFFKLQRQESAEDITQETFLRFLESKSYQDTGKAMHYLYTIARNLCMDEFRRKKTEPLPDETEHKNISGEAKNVMEDALLSKIALREALERLTVEERELLLLRYVNEVPVSVICKLHDASRFVIYRRTASAIKRLREMLGEEDFL